MPIKACADKLKVELEIYGAAQFFAAVCCCCCCLLSFPGFF